MKTILSHFTLKVTVYNQMVYELFMDLRKMYLLVFHEQGPLSPLQCYLCSMLFMLLTYVTANIFYFFKLY